MVKEKALQCIFIAEFFRLMNNTQWNAFDDTFYVLNKRWFDQWKNYVSYEYIVVTLLEKRGIKKQTVYQRIGELSINIMVNNSGQRPKFVTNKNILLDESKYYGLFSVQHRSKADEEVMSTPIYQGAIIDRDYM